jgi:hypothetical protein
LEQDSIVFVFGESACSVINLAPNVPLLKSQIAFEGIVISSVVVSKINTYTLNVLVEVFTWLDSTKEYPHKFLGTIILEKDQFEISEEK